jgi:ribonuclease HI
MESACLHTIRGQRTKGLTTIGNGNNSTTMGHGGETLVWTDGSKTNGKAGFGVYFGKGSNLNTIEQTVGDQTSDNSELQAMLKVLVLTRNKTNIHIITDNKAINILVNKLITLPNRRRVHTKRTVEKRIREEIGNRTKVGHMTACSHIYSHIKKKLVERRTDKKWPKQYEEMRERWGTLWSTIVRGNDEADLLARKGTELPPHPVFSRLID